MSYLSNTISKPTQQLGWRMDCARRKISGGHKRPMVESDICVGIGSACLPTFNEQHEINASDRMT